MLLPILELIFTLGCILEQDRFYATAANIMLGKPSRLSSTFIPANNANDGKINSAAHSRHQLQPFWQGDLQGFYSVHNITITMARYREMGNSYIGVSSVDVDCQNNDVTWCGQWPAIPPESTLTFNCSHEQPVRFVRVWRNITDNLALTEVEVEGIPKRQNAGMYDKSLNTKLGQTVTSVNAVSATDCGIKCLGNQPCLAFSYNPSVQLPCVFATSTATTTASRWATYSVSTCANDHF